MVAVSQEARAPPPRGPASPGLVNVGLAPPAQGRVPIVATWLVWCSGLLGLVLATVIGRRRQRCGVMVFTPQRTV